jgi:hypothetical protein
MSETDRMNRELNAEQRNALIRFAHEAVSKINSTQRCDREKAEYLMRRWYEEVLYEPPAFVWCDSPLQLLLLSLALETVLFPSLKPGIQHLLGDGLLDSSMAKLCTQFSDAAVGEHKMQFSSFECFGKQQYEFQKSCFHLVQESKRISKCDLMISTECLSQIRRVLSGQFGLGFPFRSRALEAGLQQETIGLLPLDRFSRSFPKSLYTKSCPRLRSQVYFSMVRFGFDSAFDIADLEFACRQFDKAVVSPYRRNIVELCWNLALSVWAYLCQPCICFLCDRPVSLLIDSERRNRLHCSDGPAVEFADGSKMYFWHGVAVPSCVVEHPETITVGAINEEPNAEIRRVMLERFGMERYLEDSSAERLHEDEFGVLYRIIPTEENTLPFSRDSLEPFLIVKVANSSPEPDDSRKEYFLRVPPYVRTAKEAVAWTFGVAGNKYHPLIET